MLDILCFVNEVLHISAPFRRAVDEILAWKAQYPQNNINSFQVFGTRTKTKRRSWALKESGQLMNDGFLPSCDIELSHGRWAGIHGKNELCTSDCCCISHNHIFITSPVVSLGMISYASHHILAEIIFNWVFPPICESVKEFCLFFLSPDKGGTLSYFGEEDDEGYDINGEACVEQFVRELYSKWQARGKFMNANIHPVPWGQYIL